MIIENTEVEARHPWPQDCLVQGGGSGVVFVKEDNACRTYRTAFVEAFPDDTFIRGEGPTIQEAEDACWVKYEQRMNCPGHEWEPRDYKNGAGFCIHCRTFGSKVFTPEQLGLFCKTCGVPTFWSRSGDDFFCPEHATDRDTEWFRREHAAGRLVTGSVLGDLFGQLEALDREEDAP